MEDQTAEATSVQATEEQTAETASAQGTTEEQTARAIPTQETEGPTAEVTSAQGTPEQALAGLTLRQRWAETIAPVRQRLGPWFSSGAWVYILIAVLVIAALLLPPISLLQRLGLTGYVRLNAENPSTSHPDGLTVSVSPEDNVSLRLKLGSVPMIDFLEGVAGPRAAVEALPQVLQVKSPYYQIDVRSRTRGPATLTVVIPNDAEPWETLDLYTWDGEEWSWVGGTMDPVQETLSGRVAALPSSVVVMQTSAVVPAIGTVTTATVSGQTADLLNEVLLPGLYLGTDGAVLGRVTTTTVSGPEPLLLLRNYRDNTPVGVELLSDLLASTTIQETHIQNIVAQATANGAAGIALDYQGVLPEQRDAFSSFVSALAAALHERDLRLEVRVPAPEQTDDGWQSGGYDWAALGASADALLVPFPDDPAAYTDGGAVASLLQWAVGQVNRYRLRAVVSSLSTDSGPDGIRRVGLEEALAPFGQVQAPDGQRRLQPGQEVIFTLAGHQVTSIIPETAAGTYAIAYQTTPTTTRTVWLGTPAFLARRLDWALRYHLGGAVVEDLLDSGNMTGTLQAVEAYRVAASTPPSTSLEVVWTVTGPGASTHQQTVTLSQPDFHWTAPTVTGTYTISASIAGVSRGAVSVTVEAPPAATSQPREATTVTTATNTCLSAAFVTDVTVPDGTHFENGETFVKTWRLRNNGSCPWPEDTVLAFVSGAQMGGPATVAVGEVEIGQTVDISVTLTAPAEDGTFTGRWVLRAGGGDIRGSEVTVMIRAGEAAAAPPPAPAPVSGGSFELGGHVRDLSLPYADLMHYAGMTWAKVQIRYPDSSAPSIVAAAHSRGFKIQLSALGSPSMVTQPGFEQNFASWVASLASAGADAIEVWNEPNIDREWQIGSIDPAAYTRLLCASYAAIKAANPGTAVISAAPAPTGWFGGCSPNGCDDQPWLEGLYNAGAANCMDYIGAHHNAGATSPSATSGHPGDNGGGHHSWYFMPQTQLYYNIFRGTRQLFYTEMGYASQEGVPTFSDQFAWARGTNNAQQAAWLAEAASLGASTGTVRCIIVWNIDFVRAGYDPQDGYAIIRPGGICPACDTLHALLGTR